MDIHNHNLNIHYSIPENLWNELVEMFAQLPHYRGFSDGCPQCLRSFSAEQRKSWDIP